MNKKLRNLLQNPELRVSEYKELRVILKELRVKQWNKELRVILKELRVKQWNRELRNPFCTTRSSGL